MAAKKTRLATTKKRAGAAPSPDSATYIYAHRDGTPNFRVLRRPGKRFWQERWDADAGSWKDKRGDAPDTPYRYPELAAAAKVGRKNVWIAEGEKDVDRLMAAGKIATCAAGGSGNTKAGAMLAEAVAALGFTTVYLCRDNDRSGRRHALRIEKAAKSQGLRVRHRAPQLRREGADVSDHLDAGLSLADLRKTRPKIPKRPTTEQRKPTSGSASGTSSEVLTRFLKAVDATPAGEGEWKARCPAHEDRTPSLTITRGTDVPVVLHCHAGCDAADVAAKAGFSMADLTRGVGDERFEGDVAEEMHRRRVRVEATRREAATQPRPAFPDRTLTDVLADPPPQVEWTVEGLLPYGGNGLVVAPMKAGKTTMAMNFVKAMVDGKPFLDRYPVRPVRGRVLYLEYELSQQQEVRWFRELGIENTDRVVPWPLRGQTLALWDDVVRDELAAICRRYEVEVVIVDPAARAMRPLVDDENNNSQVTAWTDAVDAFKDAAGIVDLIVVTHTGKAAYENGRERARGASRLEDWMDAGWYLTKDPGTGRRSFRAIGRDVEIAALDLAYDEASRALSATGKTREEARIEDGARRAARALQEVGDGVSSGRVIAAITGEKNRRQRWLAHAVELGYIERRDVGQAKRCYLTPAGEVAVESSVIEIRSSSG